MRTLSEKASVDSLDKILSSAEPCLLKGFVSHWPMVQVGPESIQSLLLSHYNKAPVHLMYGEPEIDGRLFYNDDLTGFNFSRKNTQLHTVLDAINQSQTSDRKPTYYVGSTAVDSIFPQLRKENDLPFLHKHALASIWMGNQSRIAAHYDAPDNIACVVAGKRRFTLFPPEQIDNLYIGPIDFTPAGQPASLVDFHNVDLKRFPRFQEAQKHAQVVELEAGDAIYIPANWWHHVEALDDFNVLMNYWWRQVEPYVGAPNDALLHALLAIKPLPKHQREAWRKIFEYYIFAPEDNHHIENEALGVLAELDPNTARKLRALLVNKLNR